MNTEVLEARLLLTDPGLPGGGGGSSSGGGGTSGGGGSPGDPYGGGGSDPGSSPFGSLDGLSLRPAGQQWFSNFGTEPLTGTTSLARDLPGGLGLEYRSDANGLPIIIADSEWTETSAPTSPIEARLLIDGVLHSSVFIDGAQLTQGDDIRVALPTTTALASGKYDAQIQFIADIGSGATTTAVTQEILVDNRSGSEFGAGWTLAGDEGLQIETGGVIYTNGSGFSAWFENGFAGSFTSPAGAMSESTLTENSDGTFTLQHNVGSTSQFDSGGNLTSQADAIGNTTTYARDMSGVLMSITDMYNRVTTLSWQNGLLSSVTDWANQTLDIVHDLSGYLTSITRSYHDGAGPQLPAVTNYSYDADGRVDSISESIYLVTNLTYDEGGRLSQAVLPGGATWTFDSVMTQAFVDPNGTIGTLTNPAPVVDPADAKATWTNPLAGVQEYVVNTDGHVIQYIGVDGSEVSYTRNADGQVTAETLSDPDGAGPLVAPVTQYTYNSDGKRTQAVYPGGATESWTYDANTQLLLTAMDPLGGVTTYTWNANRTLASVTDVMGAITSYTYDSYGNLLTTTLPDPDGIGPLTTTVVSYTRDSFGQATSTTVGGVTTSQTYDAAGRVTSSTDALGNTTSYVWSALGRIEQIAYPDPDGTGPLVAPVSNYTWDWYNRLDTETGPNGITTEQAYNAAGLLASTTVLDPDGAGPLTDLVTSWTYDALGRQLTATDTMNNVATATYDAAGRVLTSTSPDPDGAGPLTPSVTTMTYDAIGRLVTQTDALGNTTSVTYDDAGNVVATTNALGNSSTSTFDLAGRITSVSDALGNTTSFTYDAAGQVLTTTLPDPDGAGPLPSPTSTTTYDVWGRTVASVGFDGGTSSVEYDSLGQIVAQTAADGSVTSYTFNDAGQVLTVTASDPDGSGPIAAPVTSVVYDGLGRAIQQTNPDGSTITTAFNNLGQAVSATDSEGRTTTFGYDAFGRQNSVTDALNNTSTSTYDDLHRVTSSTDGLGNTSSFVYDNLSRLISQTDAISGTTTTEYDALGRVLSLTDPVGNETSWTYDAIGQLLSDTNELDGTRSYAYDAVGRLSSRTDRNGRIISFGYDNLGRQTLQQWMDTGVAVNTIATTYNANLRVSAISDDDSVYAFTWDSVGRLLTVDNTGTAGTASVVLTNSYDDLGRQTGLSATIDGIADFVNNYSYDANSRMSSITQIDGSPTAGSTVSDKRVDLTFDDSGRFETITRYEDLTATDEIATTTYAYDTSGRLTSLDHAFGTTSLAGYTWTWDAADRITNYTSVLDGSVAFGYDNTGQLTSEAHTDLASATQTTVYNYDANGNRITAGNSAAPATYTTGANNRTLSDGTYNYDYDAEGNRTKKTDIGTGDTVNYEWNHANLLTDVIYRDSLGVTTKSVSYQYDALGRRIGKSVDDTGNGTIDRSQSFIYDGAGLLAASGGSIQISGPNGQLNQHGWVDDLVLVFEDTDGAGPQSSSLSSRFLHGPAIDQIFAQESTSGEVLWALADHQGTVRDWAESADFDNDGTIETEVVKHLTFDAFGNIQSVTDTNGAAIPNALSKTLHAYTGQLYDADAGLHYYRARWYDSTAGQFVSEDPLAFTAGDTNTRRYIGNGAAVHTDPTGLLPEDIVTLGVYDNEDPGGAGAANHNAFFAVAQHMTYKIGASSFTQAVNQVNSHVEEHGPVDLLVLIDHCGGKPPTCNQSFGTPPVVLSPTLVNEIVSGNVKPTGGVMLAGCQVGSNLEYCWTVAQVTNLPVFASPVDVSYTGTLTIPFVGWKPYRPVIPGIRPIPFEPQSGPWYVFDPSVLPIHQIQYAIWTLGPGLQFPLPLLPTPLNGSPKK